MTGPQQREWILQSHDRANPASGVELDPFTPPKKRIALAPAKRLDSTPRTHDYQAGYAAGRRSVDVHAWMLMTMFATCCLTLLIVWFGSMLMAGI